MSNSPNANKLIYVPTQQQEDVINALSCFLIDNVRQGRGCLVGLHGPLQSGKSMIIRRVSNRHNFGHRRMTIMELSALGHYFDVRQAILRAFHLPQEVASWPAITKLPSFLDRYLRLTGLRILVLEDFHSFSSIPPRDYKFLFEFLHQLVRPPFNFCVVLVGDLGIAELKYLPWTKFDVRKLFIVGQINQITEARNFASMVLKASTAKDFVFTDDVCMKILSITDGHIGELSRFVRLLSRILESSSKRLSARDKFLNTVKRFRGLNA